MAEIIDKIETASDYDETLSLAQANFVVKDCEEKEQIEKEENNKERGTNRKNKGEGRTGKIKGEGRTGKTKGEDRTGKTMGKRRERETERSEKQKKREFTLEQVRLTQASDRRTATSSNNSERPPRIALKTIMHSFDPEKSDITLFLNLFERQANRLE